MHIKIKKILIVHKKRKGTRKRKKKQKN